MLTNIDASEYVNDQASTQYGAVRVITDNATINGYKNLMLLHQDAQTLSRPAPGMLAILDYQGPTQMQIIGFNNRIKDINYSLAEGEWTAYSQNWYSSVRVNGVEIQQAQTANKENMMMGQSTNAVLKDIMSLLVDFINWATTHTHSGVSTGGGTSGVPVQPVPDDSAVVNDQTYINDNKNLAKDGYEPK